MEEKKLRKATIERRALLMSAYEMSVDLALLDAFIERSKARVESGLIEGMRRSVATTFETAAKLDEAIRIREDLMRSAEKLKKRLLAVGMAAFNDEKQAEYFVYRCLHYDGFKSLEAYEARGSFDIPYADKAFIERAVRKYMHKAIAEDLKKKP